MKVFTRYEKKNGKGKLKAFRWDGDYEVYRTLLDSESDFIAVLDDTVIRGQDTLKLWNNRVKSWEVCPVGSYVAKNGENEYFVVPRENLINEYQVG